MSTILVPDLCNLTPDEHLNLLLQKLEDDPCLLKQVSLRERLMALEELDALIGDWGSTEPHEAVESRALALQERLEAANAELYRSIRAGIQDGDRQALLTWLEHLAPDGQTSEPAPGLGFDLRDDLLASIFEHSDPGQLPLPRSREMVTYQPTPVRHTLDLLKRTNLSRRDRFVDLGSGMGHVPLMVSMLAGVPSLGVEIEPAYVASAERCARSLRLAHASFVAADARDADLSEGTVFYLYTPFTGSILEQVLDRLQKESTKRPIRLCSLGPCTRVLERQQWLRVSGVADPDRIALFHSR